MCNAFAKRFAAVMLALGMLTALPVATAYAAEDTGYVVTFRAGEHGTFSTTYVEKLKNDYGSGDVWVNDDSTVVSVLVMDDKEMPTAPVVTTDVIINSDSTDYVAIATVDDTYVSGAVTKDYDFVAQYALRGDRQDVSYVIHYLLQGTAEEVAPSVRGTAPEGMTLTLTAASVNEYSVVGSAVQQVTMTKNADGSPVEVTFYYTQNEHVTSTTQYEDGGTTVEYNDVNVAAGGAATVGGATGGAAAGGATGGGATGGAGAGAAAGGAGDAGAAAGGAGDAGAAAGGDQNAAAEAPQAGGEEAIGDNETPQAGGEESIGDSETPLAESESGGVNVPLVVGGVAAVIVIALIVAMVIRKRRNGAD